jgi:hypothetical protein
MKKKLQNIKRYAIDCHEKTAHRYNGRPYVTHLQMVFDTTGKFIYLVPEEGKMY